MENRPHMVSIGSIHTNTAVSSAFLQSSTYATRSVLAYNFLYDVAIIHQLPPHKKVETEGEDRKVFGKLAEEFSNPCP